MARDPGPEPAEAVAAVFAAVREGDLDHAVSLFAEDCVVALPSERYEGREGVRAWHASRMAGAGPQVEASDPESVDDTHALVPLTVEVAHGETTATVRATSVWTVVDGLITAVRAVPGGRRMAIASIEGGN